ncbi:cytochrome P450 [Reyranella soli]|uniref:Cytochrome P450 n=1 Tax=Reyranella soli TaxID=1230389 RepID=A0A512N559_9HYPH|nr:cytochrome P450 [Reyranella soli]GEP54122.1 cytochrome P450 [Reyranella soli]
MSQSATAPTMADNFFLEAMKPAFREDPYPFYERFRGTAPLLRVADTIWFALGHAEVAAMLRHPRLSTDEVQHATTKAGREPDPNRARSLLFMDPPDHTRLRGLVARAFTPRRIEDLRAATEGITNELVGAMAAQRGTVDLIEAFAYPLPVRVICTLLGVPARDEAIFTDWSRGIARSLDPSILRSPQVEAAIVDARRNIQTYIGDLLAERRRKPGDDLLSALAAVDVDGDSITAREIVSLAQLLLVAGHETTVNLIGNGALALLRAPDQLALLRQRPELIGSAVDEFLRFDGPVQINQRVAMEDLDLFGQKVRKGDELLLILGAANRDPAAFPDPHRLDVTRDARKHVAFGGGIHHCLGAVLARMEGHIAFKALLEAFPAMELAAPPTRRPTFTLRGLETLPIAL